MAVKKKSNKQTTTTSVCEGDIQIIIYGKNYRMSQNCKYVIVNQKLFMKVMTIIHIHHNLLNESVSRCCCCCCLNPPPLFEFIYFSLVNSSHFWKFFF